MAGFSGPLGSLWVEIGARIGAFETALTDVAKNISGLSATVEKLGPGMQSAFDKAADAAKGVRTPLAEIDAAFTRLGVTSSSALDVVASEAKKDFDLIKASGTATARDLDAAWVKMEEARIKAAHAYGEAITKESAIALQSVRANLEETTKAFDFNKLSSGLTSFGTSLTAALTLPLVGIGTAAIKASADFDSSMRLVSARGDITGADLDRLKKQAEDLGAKTQFSSKQAAEGMAEFAGAGFKTSQIFDAMPGVMNLAAAATTSVGDASKITKDILGQFQISAGETGRVVDVLTKAGNESSGSLSEMASTLKYVGPPAVAAGLSLEQTSAAILSLDKAGIRGEQAGSSLRSMLLSLQGPSAQGAAALEQLGIKVLDTAGNIKPLPELLDLFKAGLDKVHGSGEKAALLTDIFGKNAVTAAQALITQGSPALLDFTAKLQNAGGEAERTAQMMNAGIGGAMERMGGSITTAAQKLGDIFAPQIRDIAGLIEQAANKIQDFARWFETLPEPVKMASLAVLAFTAAIGPMLVIGGQLAGSVGKLIEVINLFGVTSGVAVQGVSALTLAKSNLAAMLSATLIPALILLGTALTAIQFVQVTEEVKTLFHAMNDPSIMGAKGWFDQLAESVRSTDLASQNAAASISTITTSLNFVGPKMAETAKETHNFEENLQHVGDRIGSIKWSDILTPLGMLRLSFRDVTDAVIGFRGVFPEMEKAAAGALKNVSDYNTTAARAAADHAMESVNLGKRLAEQKRLQDEARAAAKRLADQLRDAAKGTNEHTEAVKALVWHNEIFIAQMRLESEQHKKLGEDIAKAKQTLKELGDTVVEVTPPTAYLTEEIQRLVSAAKLLAPAFLDAGKAAAEGMKPAFQPIHDLEEAYKRVGITSKEVLEQQVAQAERDYEAISNAATSSVDAILAADLNLAKKKIELAKASGEEITQAQKDNIAALEEDLGTSHKKQEGQWESFTKQVSTIISDAGKGIIDRFASMGDVNDKLDEDAAKLRENLSQREKSYQDFADNAKQSLAEANEGYAETLAKAETDLASSLKREEDTLRTSLAERTQAYEDFANEVADKIDEIKTKHEKEAAKERKAILDGLDDKTDDYDDYKDDIEKKIRGISKTQQEQAKKETDSLNKQLASRTLDYQRYVEDAQIKLGRIREKNKGQYSDEEADLLKSLARRTEDFNSYKADVATELQEITTKHAEAEAEQIASAKKALDDKTKEFDKYQAAIKTKLDDLTAKHAEELGKEVGALQKSLDDKRTDLDKFNTDAQTKYETNTANAIGKFDEIKTGAKKKLDDQELDLQTSLAKQLQQWEDYKTDANKKLQEIEDKHLGIFGQILSVGKGVFADIGAAIGRLVTETIVGSLFEKLKELTVKILPDLGSAFEKVFGIGKKVAEIGTGAADSAESLGGAAGSAGGAGGSVAGAAGNSVSAIVSAVASVGTLISSVIGNFQMAKQETTLNAIEESTRYIKIWTGEGSNSMHENLGYIKEYTGYLNTSVDAIGGRMNDAVTYLGYINTTTDALGVKLDNWLQPLGGQFNDINTYLGYINTTTNALGVKLDNWLQPLGGKLVDLSTKADSAYTRLWEISISTFNTSASAKDGTSVLNLMLTELRTMNSKAQPINVYVNGALQTQTTSNLKMQGVLGI